MAREGEYCLYTAVLPFYRLACLEVLRERLGNRIVVCCGQAHLDPTVTTRVPQEFYRPVRNIPLLRRRALLQWGEWHRVLQADAAILDLNPRSLSAWILLLLRKAVRRRTLVWGHLFPREGPGAGTARLRTGMRRLADGVILYSYSDAEHVRAHWPDEAAWVAPNALYRRADLASPEPAARRRNILYVGRLEPEKRPDLLVRAFALWAGTHAEGDLVLLGDGSLRDDLERLAAELGVRRRVQLHGVVTSPAELRKHYATSFVSVSPGYAGLSLTQSLGFGVPMLIADDEPHAPEFEIARSGGVVPFRARDERALAAALDDPALFITDEERDGLAGRIRDAYSAERMASGLEAALRGRADDLVA